MDGKHDSVNDGAKERITLDDLILVEDVYYHEESAPKSPDELADRRDQEMLEANGVSNCEVHIEAWPADDDEGNAVDSDQDELNYDELEISEESETDQKESINDGSWKSLYEAWMQTYKIPRKVPSRDEDVQRRQRNDEACGSGTGESSEDPRKRKSRNNNAKE